MTALCMLQEKVVINSGKAKPSNCYPFSQLSPHMALSSKKIVHSPSHPASVTGIAILCFCGESILFWVSTLPDFRLCLTSEDRDYLRSTLGKVCNTMLAGTNC